MLIINTMLIINDHIIIPESEIQIQAIRAQGAGGQNVNKVATAVHLRFDISASSLPVWVKERLLALKDQRISKKTGILVIKAQRFRTQEKNREDALTRLKILVQKVLKTPKKRRQTKPKPSSVTKRLDSKTKQSRIKQLRKKVEY